MIGIAGVARVCKEAYPDRMSLFHPIPSVSFLFHMI